MYYECIGAIRSYVRTGFDIGALEEVDLPTAVVNVLVALYPGEVVCRWNTPASACKPSRTTGKGCRPKVRQSSHPPARLFRRTTLRASSVHLPTPRGSSGSPRPAGSAARPREGIPGVPLLFEQEADFRVVQRVVLSAIAHVLRVVVPELPTRSPTREHLVHGLGVESDLVVVAHYLAIVRRVDDLRALSVRDRVERTSDAEPYIPTSTNRDRGVGNARPDV